MFVEVPANSLGGGLHPCVNGHGHMLGTNVRLQWIRIALHGKIRLKQVVLRKLIDWKLIGKLVSSHENVQKHLRKWSDH